jgi:hypothetical protein
MARAPPLARAVRGLGCSALQAGVVEVEVGGLGALQAQESQGVAGVAEPGTVQCTRWANSLSSKAVGD